MPYNARNDFPLNASPLTAGARAALFALCILALGVRMGVALFLPSIVQQDETFQYLEQAHRLVFGQGLIPWEYIVGLRSWLFPGLIAGVVELSRIFGDSPQTASLSIALFMSILSLSPVICGFFWGWRGAGLPGAVAAGALNAFWFEIVYFSGHTLSETLAADALVLGLYLAYPSVPATSKKALFLGGLFLGLALTLRLQLGPAIAIGAFAICGTDIRGRYVPMILGGLLPIAFGGLLDGLTWDWPFQSMALNFWINVKEGVAAQFGKSPIYQYLGLQVTYWSGAFMLIVALALYAGRRLPVLLAVAVTIFVTHTLLSHKEYRFTYPALPLVMTLAGIGSARILGRLCGGDASRRARLLVLYGAPLFWIVTSLILARSREFYPLWYRDRGSIEAMRLIDEDDRTCGVAIYPAYLWDRSGGYNHLRRGTPLYGYQGGDAPADIAAFNYIVGYKPADFTAQGFTRLRCWAEPPGRTIQQDPICLWHRNGACAPETGITLTATPPAFLTKAHPDWFDKSRK
jgi:hypothetical protein